MRPARDVGRRRRRRGIVGDDDEAVVQKVAIVRGVISGEQRQRLVVGA